MSSELEELKALLREAEARAQEEKALRREAEARTREAEARTREVERNPHRTIILSEIAVMKDVANANGKKLYYDNQSATAREVSLNINEPNIVFQMVLATCQAGKTGCMFSLMETIIEMDSNIDISRIYIITGLSSKAWELQTQERMPKGLRGNIIHRGQFKNNVSRFRNLKNAVIIVDECQIACDEGMTFDKLLQDAGIKDLKYLRDNNVNIVEFSATPNSTLGDLELWQEDNACLKHIMAPGNGYKGSDELLNEGRIHQAEDLYIDIDKPAGLSPEAEQKHKQKIQPARDAIKELKEFITRTYALPKNHVIRVPTGKKEDVVIGRFKEIFGDLYEYTKCNCTIGKDLVEELKKTPTTHTLIFIKETARCAVTFEDIDDPTNDVKGNIGVLYERIPKTISDDVIIQGLAGRVCGYGSNNMMVFTNIPSIKRYAAMVKSGFEVIGDFTWRGKNGKKTSHLHPNGYTEHNSMVATEQIREVPGYKISITQEDCKKFNKVVFGGNPGLPKRVAPKTLRDANNANPTRESLLDRGWGLNGKIIRRSVAILDGTFCTYWKPSSLSSEQINIIENYPE